MLSVKDLAVTVKCSLVKDLAVTVKCSLLKT